MDDGIERFRSQSLCLDPFERVARANRYLGIVVPGRDDAKRIAAYCSGPTQYIDSGLTRTTIPAAAG